MNALLMKGKQQKIKRRRILLTLLYTVLINQYCLKAGWEKGCPAINNKRTIIQSERKVKFCVAWTALKREGLMIALVMNFSSTHHLGWRWVKVNVPGAMIVAKLAREILVRRKNVIKYSYRKEGTEGKSMFYPKKKSAPKKLPYQLFKYKLKTRLSSKVFYLLCLFYFRPLLRSGLW